MCFSAGGLVPMWECGGSPPLFSPAAISQDEFILLALCRGEGRRFQELVEAEEFAAEGAAVGGPFGFAGNERENGTGGASNQC